MNNPETLAILGTQDTKQGQTKRKKHTRNPKNYKHGPHKKIGCEPRYSYTLLYRHHSEVLHISLCKYSSKLCFNGLLLSGYIVLYP